MKKTKKTPPPKKVFTPYDTRPVPSITPVYKYALVNCPGKSIVGLLVDFPPNAATPPHRHGGASVAAYVIKGALVNKMNDGPTKIIPAGGSWYEAPGCHHKTSDNASETEPAQMMASFIVDTKAMEEGGPDFFVQIDPEYADVKIG